jgi:hypothetical protein
MQNVVCVQESCPVKGGVTPAESKATSKADAALRFRTAGSQDESSAAADDSQAVPLPIQNQGQKQRLPGSMKLNRPLQSQRQRQNQNLYFSG